MENIILIAILILIVGVAIAYLIRAKKRGVKCVGCPYAEECAKKSKGCGSCSCDK